MLRRSLTRLALPWLLAAAACKDSPGPDLLDAIVRPLRPCTAAGFAATLSGPGDYLAFDPGPDSGCVVFAANPSAAALEYLIVPQLATGVPGRTSSFRLRGDTIRPTLAAALAPSPTLADLASAERFHAFLRLSDETRWWGFAPQLGPALAPARAGAAPAGPPGLGSQREFMVCARLDCSNFERVTATAQAVKTKVAIYVDDAAPANGLTTADLDALATQFDTQLYAIDTAAFGRESDIDANTVVLVLMTPVVNRLMSKDECPQFIAGFFLGADLDPAFRNDARSNKGEVFYSFVADPTGSVGCAHNAASVSRFLPVTFIHEFQHMISFNRHVLVGRGLGEVLWLNEGLSHYAEELGGRSFLPAPDGTVAACTRGTTACNFLEGNLFNAYRYLDATADHFLVPSAGVGSLAERGAAWLFVRYLVDRYAGGQTRAAWNAFTRQRLLDTAATGAQNIEAATDSAFADVVTRWALANWVSDLPVPGFTAPPELRYDSWAFRAVYASLNQQSSSFPKQFPLTPTASAGRDVTLSGTLRAGSGVYHRVLHAPSASGFTLLFSMLAGGALRPSLGPRLNVIRVR